MKHIPNIGERIVVHGMTAFDARVEDVEWDASRHDWCIRLTWIDHGKSRVWLHDESKVWYRWDANS